MIRPEDFQICIEYDSHGVLVIVGHAISGIERRARPSLLESVGKVKERLLAEIEREFYDSADIRIDCGHGRRDGKVYDFIRVVHLPTGIDSAFEIVSHTSTAEA